MYTTWTFFEGNRYRRRPTRRWRDELYMYWKDIWKKIVQDRQMWKQHAAASHNDRILRLHNDDGGCQGTIRILRYYKRNVAKHKRGGGEEEKIQKNCVSGTSCFV